MKEQQEMQEMSDEEDNDFSFFDDEMIVEQETEEEKRQKAKRHKRAQIMSEFIETERNYVRDLQILVERYQEPLQIIMPPAVFKQVFAHTDTILNINRMFLQRLEKEVLKSYGAFDDEKEPFANGEENELASLLIHFSHSFKLYTTYISNYPAAANALMAARKTIPEVAAFLRRTNAQLKLEGLRISSELGYLVIPVQRIPRYKMLCMELLKVTEESEASHPHMKKALGLMSEIALYCNSKNREMEQHQKLFELRKELGLKNLVQRGRKLELEVNATQLASVELDGKELTCTALYLFTDLLVCSLRRQRSLSMSLHPRFTCSKVIERGFSLSYSDAINEVSQVLRVEFQSQDDADEWNGMLDMCLQRRRRHSILTQEAPYVGDS